MLVQLARMASAVSALPAELWLHVLRDSTLTIADLARLCRLDSFVGRLAVGELYAEVQAKLGHVVQVEGESRSVVVGWLEASPPLEAIQRNPTNRCTRSVPRGRHSGNFAIRHRHAGAERC